MDRDQLLDALVKTLPSELALIIAKLGVQQALLPTTTQAERCIAVLHWAEQRNRLVDVERFYLEVTGRATSPMAARWGSTPTAMPATTPARCAAPASSPSFAFPLPLLDAYRNGKLVVLFGSGLSLAKDVTGNFPRWNELPERLLDEAVGLGIWSQAQIDAKRAFFKAGHVSLEGMLAELDSIKTMLRSTRRYRAALTALFQPANAAPGDVHRALVDIGVNVLLTTNFDELLESVEASPSRRAYTWQKADKALDDIQSGRKVLFKIHGTAEDDDTVVMTRAEYDKAAAHEGYHRTMSFLLQSYTFLLVGYGINDPLDLDLVFGLNAGAFGAAARTHYALMKDASPTDRDRWLNDMNVQVVSYQDHGALPAILRALRAAKPSATIPPPLTAR